ncbi:MAG TPA: hypothetical protein DG048_04190 [Pseudoalteromonas sp.]|nr:hypothetical protein [Pseudoalteromonas sp.]|tara:strand:- start:276 stop:2282 length:2007 start_codon:yes stop_codon:yes gene_type:complete
MSEYIYTEELKKQFPDQNILNGNDDKLNADDLFLSAKEKKEKFASFRTLMEASNIDDPRTKMALFAARRFPDDNSAINRYAIKDGEVIYVDDDGEAYYETPKGLNLREFGADLSADLIRGTIGLGAATYGAGMLASRFPINPPQGRLAALGISGAGGMLAEGGRKIAGLAYGEPLSGEILTDMVSEGIFSVAGDAILGGSVLSYLNRKKRKDIEKLDRDRAKENIRKAKEFGIDLNLAQSSDVPSVKGDFETLARQPETKDVMVDSLLKQEGQAREAANKFFTDLSKIKRRGPQSVGRTVARKSKEFFGELKDRRQQLSNQEYRKAFDKAITDKDDLSVLRSMKDRPIYVVGLKNAQTILKNDGIVMSDFAMLNTVEGLHYLKMGMREAMSKATEGIGGIQRGQVTQQLKFIDEVLAKASPEYVTATALYRKSSDRMRVAEDSLLGEFRDVDDPYKLVIRSLGSAYSPADIRRARLLFRKAGLQDEWSSISSEFLQNQFRKVNKEVVSEDRLTREAPKYARKMLGDSDMAARIKAALPKDQLEQFTNLLKVFDRIGRVNVQGGSITQPLQATRKDLEQRAKSGPMLKMMQLLKIDLARPLAFVPQFFENLAMDGYNRNLAEILTDPAALDRLDELKKLSPKTEKFYSVLGAMVGISMSPQETPEDFAP